MMRADLHVHSIHSGARHYRRAGMRDSYSRPGDIYDAARKAGMDLVTLTDLDTIEGCLRLIDERGDPPDFITGEEVEASIPDSPLRVHLNVWGIGEAEHAEIARRKESVEDLAAWLKERGIPACFNHFVGRLPVDLPSAALYWRVISLFDAIEVRNGFQGPHYNALAAQLAAGEAARRAPLAFVGGSDAHTLRRVGTTWTSAEARSREEFLLRIREGRTAAGGRVRTRSDVLFEIGSLTAGHLRYLGRSLGRRENGGPAGLPEVLRAAAALPLQAIGAPLIGTAAYFLRVRAQVRALQREIATLDLTEFRERMRSFPRSKRDAAEPFR